MITLQKRTLKSGKKLNSTDINISDDNIITKDLTEIKEYLTESAWSLLEQEGKCMTLTRCNDEQLHVFYTPILHSYGKGDSCGHAMDAVLLQ